MEMKVTQTTFMGITLHFEKSWNKYSSIITACLYFHTSNSHADDFTGKVNMLYSCEELFTIADGIRIKK